MSKLTAEREGEPSDGRPNLDTVTIITATSELGVNPDGGHVSRWRVLNPLTGKLQDILYRGKWPNRNGIPPVFPYFGPGKNKGDPDHGVGMYSMWHMEEPMDGKISMKLTQEDLTEEMRSACPYDFETTVAVQTSEPTDEEHGSLLYDMTIINNGSDPMHTSPALHNFWDVPHERKKDIHTKGVGDFDASKFDWIKDCPDTPYEFKNRADIEFADKTIIIEDISPRGPVITNLQVWADEFNPNYDHNYVCFEPITRDKSQTHRNPIIIQPGGKWEMRLKFSVKFASPQTE